MCLRRTQITCRAYAYDGILSLASQYGQFLLICLPENTCSDKYASHVTSTSTSQVQGLKTSYN